MFTLETVAGWLISFLVAFLTKWLADKRAEKAQRDLGYEQARTDASAVAADRLAQARTVEAEAEKDHASKPGDDAFDQDFMRKD